jgi:hypothetical protein
MEENLTKQTQQRMSEAWVNYQFLPKKKKISPMWSLTRKLSNSRKWIQRLRVLKTGYF